MTAIQRSHEWRCTWCGDIVPGNWLHQCEPPDDRSEPRVASVDGAVRLADETIDRIAAAVVAKLREKL